MGVIFTSENQVINKNICIVQVIFVCVLNCYLNSGVAKLPTGLFSVELRSKGSNMLCQQEYGL